jgi:hypothetical protein
MSESKQGPYAADDFDELRKHLERVQSRPWRNYATPVEDVKNKPLTAGQAAPQMPRGTRCALQDGRYKEIRQCSCQDAGPNGRSAKCPPLPGFIDA